MRLLLTAVLLALTLSASAQDCTPPHPDYLSKPEVGCPTSRCSNLYVAQWQLDAWAEEARDEVRKAVEDKRLINLGTLPCWDTTPIVVTTSCHFWMRDTYWFNFQTQRYERGDTCAVGTTEFRGYRVIVSAGSGNLAEVRNLVKVETRNVYLQWMQRYDFIDRWTPKSTDPYAAYQHIRRRSVRLR
jgi:hypothetical protein